MARGTRRIRKASISTSTGKGNSRTSSPSVSNTSRLGTMDSEKAEVLIFFFLPQFSLAIALHTGLETMVRKVVNGEVLSLLL